MAKTSLHVLVAGRALFAATRAHGDGAAPSRVDPKADALLRAMSAELAHMKAFQVDTNYMAQVVETVQQ
jgi:hypothetical protein